MLNFYDVDPQYADFLRQFEAKVPEIAYPPPHNKKFVCGIVLTLNGYNYFAPISSKKKKQQTSMLIKDRHGKVLSSIKFQYMFPAPLVTVRKKDFKFIATTDPAYATLLGQEYLFCKNNEPAILQMAQNIYNIGCTPTHVLQQYCCNYKLLEQKHDEWIHEQDIGN